MCFDSWTVRVIIFTLTVCFSCCTSGFMSSWSFVFSFQWGSSLSSVLVLHKTYIVSLWFHVFFCCFSSYIPVLLFYYILCQLVQYCNFLFWIQWTLQYDTIQYERAKEVASINMNTWFQKGWDHGSLVQFTTWSLHKKVEMLRPVWKISVESWETWSKAGKRVCVFCVFPYPVVQN